MKIERINPSSLPAPKGFSHAVVAEGRVVFLAGQTGLDIDGKVVDGGLVAQFEQALSNLLVALEEAGGQPEQLTAMTIYIVDMDDYLAHATELGRVWRRLVDKSTLKPSMSCECATARSPSIGVWQIFSLLCSSSAPGPPRQKRRSPAAISD